MEQLKTIKHRNKQEKRRKNSELLTIPETFVYNLYMCNTSATVTCFI